MARPNKWTYRTDRETGDLIVTKKDDTAIEGDDMRLAQRAAKQYMAFMYRRAGAKPKDFEPELFTANRRNTDDGLSHVRVRRGSWVNP